MCQILAGEFMCILGTGLGHSHRTYFATCTGPGGARCLSPSTCLNMTYGILLSCVVLSFGHLKGWPLLPSGAIKSSLLKHHPFTVVRRISKLATSSSGTSQPCVITKLYKAIFCYQNPIIFINSSSIIIPLFSLSHHDPNIIPL